MLKRYMKHAKWIRYTASFLLYIYLRITYLTLRRAPLLSTQQDNSIISTEKSIGLLWHKHLAVAPFIMGKLHNAHALASPHSDGQIIGYILQFLGHKVIWGSSNRNPLAAVKQIYSLLKTNVNIIVTPDGPKGPAQKFNSNIEKIAQRTNTDLILMSCKMDKYITLNSWDKMIIPLPFAKIVYNYTKIAAKDLPNNNIKEFLTQRMNTLLSDNDSRQGTK